MLEKTSSFYIGLFDIIVWSKMKLNLLLKTKEDKLIALEILRITSEMFPSREEMNRMGIEGEDVINEMILRIVKSEVA